MSPGYLLSDSILLPITLHAHLNYRECANNVANNVLFLNALQCVFKEASTLTW